MRPNPSLPPLVSGASLSEPAPVDIFPMPDLDYEDDQVFVLDRVDDAVVAFADAVEVVRTSELFDPVWTRIVLELPKAPNDP